MAVGRPEPREIGGGREVVEPTVDPEEHPHPALPNLAEDGRRLAQRTPCVA
jgi:hypothetical protein